MVIEEKDFISEDECQLLLSIMNDKLSDKTFHHSNFYHWENLTISKDAPESLFLQDILQKHIDFLNTKVEKRDWVVEYCGFAYQTKGFPYHADAVWPTDEKDRNLGDPNHDHDGFTKYDGEWIPNYVPTRLFTTVLYLNQVVGGETDFPTLNLRVKPETKKLLGFHCDENHVHGVLPTTKGVRKAFIVWYE